MLHIVKNYTGDVLNFETAAELADADDIEVRTVIVNDDVAVEDSLYTAGRRGVAGTVCVEKIAGPPPNGGTTSRAWPPSPSGSSRTCAPWVSPSRREPSRTRASPSFDLTEEEMEIGIGIHGEPGRHRVPMASADEVTEQLLRPVVEDLGLAGGEQVLLFVNGMGGTPAVRAVRRVPAGPPAARGRGVTVARSLVGSYVTSLEMQGASVTVLRLDDELTALWDAPVHTAALRW